MFFKLLGNFEINDYIFLSNTILIVCIAHYYYKYFTRVNPIPGPFPFPFPFIGYFPWINKDAQKFYSNCYEKYGDIYELYGSIRGSVRTIVLCRREYLEDLLSESTHGLKFPNRKGLEWGLSLNDNFKTWMFNRHFFNQTILSPKFADEAIDCINKLFNELENYWDRLFLKEEFIKENKNKLDFSKWFNHYTNDMIISLLTGAKSYTMAAYFDTFSDEKSHFPSAIINDSVKFVQALNNLLIGYLIFFIVSPLLRNYVPYFKNKADDLLRNKDFIDQKLNAMIKRRRKEIGDIPLDEPLPHDMLTSMIIKNTLRDNNYIETGEIDRPMTDTEIRVNLFDGILSGTYKSANMLTFIIYYISHNPDVKKKMLEEIDSIFQGDKTRSITKDDFYSLSYCEAIVKEAARVFPIKHMLTRCIDKPDEMDG
ncbi:cytochrome P450 [Rhizophagus irregularis]|uniref:Cytochrome P450 n=1 Tax=Rhizophagus irregularis TaxID=588596 RepID=A0A2N0PC98_9GLOM|nr:cytochrome P450 [Rhizophagus irregularis]